MCCVVDLDTNVRYVVVLKERGRGYRVRSSCDGAAESLQVQISENLIKSAFACMSSVQRGTPFDRFNVVVLGR